MDKSLNPSRERAPLPQNPEEFDADDRVSFSKLNNKFILEAEDGQEFEYDHALKRWVEVVRFHPPWEIEEPLKLHWLSCMINRFLIKCPT